MWRVLKGCQDLKSEEFYTVKCERGETKSYSSDSHFFIWDYETNFPSFFFQSFPLQTIGIDSEFCIVESLVTGIVDMWPDLLRPRRRQFTTGICILLFLLGVPMVTNGGAYVFQVRQESHLHLMTFIKKLTVFKNHPKCRIWYFSPIFWPIKIELSGNSVWT